MPYYSLVFQQFLCFLNPGTRTSRIPKTNALSSMYVNTDRSDNHFTCFFVFFRPPSPALRKKIQSYNSNTCNKFIFSVVNFFPVRYPNFISIVTVTEEKK